MNKTDVVENGITQDFFKPFRADEAGTNYQAYSDETTFYIRLDGRRIRRHTRTHTHKTQTQTQTHTHTHARAHPCR